MKADIGTTVEQRRMERDLAVASEVIAKQHDLIIRLKLSLSAYVRIAETEIAIGHEVDRYALKISREVIKDAEGSGL